MSTQTRIRRDTLANLNTVIPADGEMAYNLTDDRLHMGDGATTGGIPHVNFKDFQKDYFSYITAAGTANALTATLPYAPTYTAGLRVKIKAANTNSGAATINVNALGAKNIFKLSGGVLGALTGGEIVSGAIYSLEYDGTQFQLIGREYTSTTPDMVLLASQTASASSVLDFTSTITSSYKSYRFIVKSLRPATTATQFLMRLSTNNGSSYVASGYAPSGLRQQDTQDGTTQDGQGGLTTGITICGGSTAAFQCHNLATTPIQGIIDLINPLATAHPTRIQSLMSHSSANLRTIITVSGGQLSTNQDTDAVRFLMSSGNMTSGTIDCYGFNGA